MGIVDGFIYLFGNPIAFVFILLGAISGIFIGALPGLTAAAAIAMLLPITFYLDPLSALAFLYVIGKAGRYGGSIASILFNTPGTAASAATLIEGYPMTRSGKGGKALKMATVAAVIGDLFGELILIFGAVFISSYTEKFGPPEYFAIYLMAFVVIGSVVGKSVTKGLISTFVGAFIALIGLDPISGEPRLTAGFLELESGFSLVPLLIGIFVMSEVLVQAVRMAGKVREKIVATLEIQREGNTLSIKEVKQCLPTIFRSSVIGACIGMMPGLGSAVSCFIAYGEEKRRAPEKEWGTGILEGVAAPEAGSNAVSGPSMIPLLALGVPGSTIAAILIGVFLIHGIKVGPTIFVEAHDLIFGLFACGLVGIITYGVIGYWSGPMIGRVIGKVSPKIIYPFIFLTAFIATYTTSSSLFDVGVMIFFGLVGYIIRQFNFSAAAFVIAFVLARGAEESLRQSMLLSDSGLFVFLERPVAIGFMLLGFSVLVGRIVSTAKKRK